MKNTKCLTLMILAAAVMPFSLANPALGFEPDAMSAKAYQAPTMDAKAKEIWDRAVEVSMGDTAEDQSIKSIRLTGTMSMPSQGITATMNVLIATGQGVYVTLDIPGMGSFEQGLSGDVAWSTNMMEGPKILDGDEAKQFHKQGDLYADLHWDRYYQSVTSKGQETITLPDDTEVMTNTLELLSIDDDTVSTHYFSVESGLLVKSVTDVIIAGGAKIPSTAYTMDYRDVGGIMIPFRTVSSTGPMQQIIEFTTVEVNVEIGDDELALPEEIQELLED